MIDLSVHIDRMKKHIAADELVRGTGFEGGRGGFIGCTFDKYDHRYASETTGVPEWLWRLGDALHENMSASVALGDTAVRILQACHGRDKTEFLPIERSIHIYIQRRNIEIVTALDIDAGVKAGVLSAIESVISGYEAELPDDAPEWSAAESAAESASWSAAESAAWSAARSAAESAAWSAARSEARSAARSAAESAASASSAESPARSASWSAAWSAAWSDTYDKIGSELLRLLEARSPTEVEK